jgi:hypothetical protein
MWLVRSRPVQEPLFFVHVMKTGGTTFRHRLVREFGAESVFPCAKLDPPELGPNVQVGYLSSASPDRLVRIKAFSGHYPFFATELVPRSPRVLTILRDPVERTISYLKQHHRDRGLGSERSLESIYDLEWHRLLHMHNYQVRVFASTADEGIQSVLHWLDIDDRRMKIAKEHLDRVEFLGLTEHSDEFVSRVVEQLGWSPDTTIPNQRVSEPMPVPESLRRRIAADNEADLEFYAYARELVAKPT